MDWAVLGPLPAQIGQDVTTSLLKRATPPCPRWRLCRGSGRALCGPANASGHSSFPDHAQERRHPELLNVVKRNGGVVISYGDKPSSTCSVLGLDELGEALFMQNCASCHGTKANGVPAYGVAGAYPDLVGLGPATIDFWIDSGRMPANERSRVEALRRFPRLTPNQALAIAAWVDSLYPELPGIPTPNLKRPMWPTVPRCSRLTARPVTPLRATATPWPEHLRAVASPHPGFPGGRSDSHRPRQHAALHRQPERQASGDIVAYVTTEIQHPENPGGFGLGGLGPVAEGFVALLIGVGVLVLVGFWVGERE